MESHRVISAGPARPDGFFSYLFQLPNLTLSFPYFKETSAAFIYPGRTIAEPMFGGVIAVFPFLWLLFRARKVYPVLRQKGLVTFALLPPVLALVVILADTEMAGILWRYTGDFLLLLYLGAVLIFLALLEDAKENERPRLLCFLVCTTFLTLLICLLISLESSQYLVRSPESYCRLKDFMSFG